MSKPNRQSAKPIAQSDAQIAAAAGVPVAAVQTIAAQISAAAAPLAPAPVVADPLAAIGKNTAAAVVGAKQHIRALLSVPGAALTLQELCQKSGKTEVNVRTMLSDLRSPKYAGKSGIFATISTRGADGKTRYSAAPVAAPAK